MENSTSSRSLGLLLLPGEFVICRLPASAPIPDWASRGDFSVIARSREELSIMCSMTNLPTEVSSNGAGPGITPSRMGDPALLVSAGWRAFRLQGPLDLDQVGVLVSVAAPLADARVSIMPVATFDTDYLLVRTTQLETALSALHAAGHEVMETGS